MTDIYKPVYLRRYALTSRSRTKCEDRSEDEPLRCVPSRSGLRKRRWVPSRVIGTLPAAIRPIMSGLDRRTRHRAM